MDGWALTMLSRENVGYASTCNSVGQTAGYFLGNVLFLALESADFCNKYLRDEPQDRGVVTLSGKDQGVVCQDKNQSVEFTNDTHASCCSLQTFCFFGELSF